MDEELQKIVDKIISARNRAPGDDFDGLNPEEMYNMLYYPFSEQCPVQLKENIDIADLKSSPIFNIALDLLVCIHQQNGLKLTPSGNLQRQVMRELYDKKYLPDILFESGIGTIRTEQDWVVLHNVKIVLKLAGIIRQAKGRLLLVKKWENKLVANDHYAIYTHFFKNYTSEFNWAYNDGYENEQTGQQGFAFLLYLIHKYGQDFRDIHFYTEKYFRAFPMLYFKDNPLTASYSYDNAERVVYMRFFERFAERFGFVEIGKDKENPYFQREMKIRRTDFFDKSFVFNNPDGPQTRSIK